MGAKKLSFHKDTVFGNLTVIRELTLKEKNVLGYKKQSSRYECICNCGNTCIVEGVKLKTGHTKTCGCSRNAKKDAQLSLIYNSYKTRASKIKIDFKLTKEKFQEIIKSNCNYCGIPPNNKLKHKFATITEDYFYNGVDRINSDLGYTLNNVVPCCEQCNRMKLDWSREEFLNKVSQIYKFLNLN